uniref:Nucleoprotein TPR n=1 Tax=Pundamilia nyererei TaxID=303518 RepID=A0A3B4G672_9CICH
MAVVLLQALERTELNKLPKGIQNKLEKFVTELQNANEVLQTQHERFKADSGGYLEQYCLCTYVWIQQTKTKYEIEAEKRELERLLEKRTQEVENVSEDVKRLNEKLTDSNKVKMELQLKLDEIQSSAASVQHREKRMEQEKELLEKKIEWLTAELKTKTEELLNTNREKGEEILELQSSLKSSEQKVRLIHQLTVLKETGESQNKRAEDLNNKLKQVKDEKSAMEEKYRNELNAHVKLSSLYKGAATDMETKTQELSRAVEELSKLVKETLEANKALEKKVSEGEELKTRLEEELKEKVKKMEKELENATVKAAGMPSMTEEQLDAMCPSAASIAAIVKPGMKFFDLYNAYAECQTQLQLEKQETRRVSRVLDEIVQEVESKAPVLKQQREEYESMQRSMASLCNKLEQARTVKHLQKEKEEVKQHCDTLEREKLRIERLLEDTSAQVCGLLVELEEARGNHVTKDDGSSADISRTSEVISPHQLSFRSVEELQRHNQSLLGRLRELEEEKDKQQSQVTSARISELESSVDRLHKEVEQLREQRNQQKQLADSNARQRDMYKALLTQSTGQDSSPQPAQGRSSIPATRSTPQRAAAAESAPNAQTKAALKQLNDAFALYKKEKAENDRILNETNDRLQRQLTELRSSHAKLTSQLEFSNKRYEILQEAVSAYRREIVILQERNQKMSVTAQRHEHIIHTMSQDLRQANEKIALEEVRVENLTKERDMLRQAESRLSREKEAMLAEQRNQNLLLTNLKTIQLTMERAETETRQHLNNKIEQLESELASMKTRLEQEVAQRHALGRTMDAQLLEAKKQLETQNTLQQKTRELLRSSEQQVAALKAQLASATSSEATMRSPVPAASQLPSQSEQELSEVKGLLHSVEEKKSELEEQLKSANASVEQYRSVVLTLEDSLEKEKELRSPLEVRLKESEEVQKQLEKKILELEKMKQQEQEERRKAVGAVEKQVCELQRSLKASRVEQQEALERAAAAVTLEQKAVQDSLLQTKLAGEAQAKYERELMLHAADVEALQELKKKFQQGAAQKMELEEELKKTTSLLQEKTAAWSTAEKKLKEDLSNQSRHCEELGKQNSLLHEQMDEIAAKSRQLQQQQQPQQLDLSFSEEGKTTEQILEILRFVRREKDIAIAQCEASDGEALRYKQQVEHQERELKELQETLNAEREKMQATAKTLVQQEEQLKKMETISALRETNKMLKMDRDKLEQELQQAQAKITKLQSDISPLHHSLSVLSEKNGSLQADKRLLEEDLKRLKAKNQQLISQQKDGDVEERQKLTTEREAQQKRITQLAEETAKLKAELASGNSAQSQLHGLRESVARLTSERDSLKKDLETKNNDIVEKNKTITQVCGNGLDPLTVENNCNGDLCLSFPAANMLSVTKICDLLPLPSGAKEQLSQEVEELKQSKEELEVRMNALKSQYEGRLLRLDRELRERRETQTHSDAREETQDQSGAKMGDQTRSADQRQISLKSPAQDRGSSTLSEPPTANIRPTPSTPSPSNKPSPSPGSKATPRASIRPLVTLATVPVPTPMATVMPTTQTESQEVLMNTSASVHSTSSSMVNAPTSISQPSSTQATAFVQPTQQQAASQDAGPSVEAERPSTSSSPSSLSVTGQKEKPETLLTKHLNSKKKLNIVLKMLMVRFLTEVLVCFCDATKASSKRSRDDDDDEEEEEESRPESSHTPPTTKKLRLKATAAMQRQASQLRRPSSGRGPQLTPGIGSMQPFFDDDDRMVPSTPTLVVPHRTDGFAEAIHSPQVAGLSTRFRFGPPEDLLPQTSASHSDLGQLASQGGLGMYESPLFLAAHDEDGGGRSVPTTPLQVAAPVTVFTESLPSDSSDNMASQSVPMVTASTGMAAATDDGDEVFMEQEVEGPGIESTLESQTDMESAGQQSDDASLPSTSQDPGNVFCLLTDRCQSNHILCKVVIKVKTVLN